jgi:type I restriction enzyme, R subunit
MSEYAHVEKPLLTQLAGLGWIVIDHGAGAIPHDPNISLRASFRDLVLPAVFRDAVRTLNQNLDGRDWLAECQLAGLVDDIFRRPHKSLLEANEAVQALQFKAQVDRNELTGEIDPTVRLIDFAHPERNVFHRHQPVPRRDAGLRQGVHHSRHRAVRERPAAGHHRGQDR